MNSTLNRKIKSGLDFFVTQQTAFNAQKSVIISFLNPFSYYQVAQDKSLVDGVDYYFSDGGLLCRLHNLFHPRITRASFDYSSIADSFFLEAQRQQKSIAIIGAKNKENELAVIALKQAYPTLNIVYNRDGYIDDIDHTILTLNDRKPDIVIVGMGAPHQEKLALILKRKLIKATLIITCGGFLTQTAIKADYYHPFIKKLGLRWLQRMYMHKHVRERVLKVYPKFVFKYTCSMIGAKIAKK